MYNLSTFVRFPRRSFDTIKISSRKVVTFFELSANFDGIFIGEGIAIAKIAAFYKKGVSRPAKISSQISHSFTGC